MIQMFYDYNTKYTTKHSAAYHDNDTDKSWLSFTCAIIITEV